MILTEKETTALKELQTQEKICMDHYNLCAASAKDQGLKDLFSQIAKDEQDHYRVLGKLMEGEIPSLPESRLDSSTYHPAAAYDSTSNQGDKQHDEILCSDSIGNEKMVSSDYNAGVFRFGSSDLRKVLNRIQTQEQQHAEMIYKYKQQNGMTASC